jgi:hypothetical protein
MRHRVKMFNHYRIVAAVVAMVFALKTRSVFGTWRHGMLWLLKWWNPARMVSAVILLLLLIEVAVYAGLALWLTALGVPAGQIAALILLLALLWRLSHALTSYVVAAGYRWLDKRSLPLGNSLAALASELSARAVSFNWSQPFALGDGR